MNALEEIHIITLVHGNNEYLSEGFYMATKAVEGIDFRSNVSSHLII